MSIRKSILIAIAISILIIIVAMIGIKSVLDMQYDTCKRTTQLYLADQLKKPGMIKTESIPSQWLKIDEDAEDNLFELVMEIDNSECRRYPYLPQGKDASGSDLDLFVRNTDRIEVKIND